VTYWWTIITAAEDRLTTEPRTFVYADNRFDWQTLSDGIVNVHWYRGDLKVAQLALDVAVAGLNRARQDIDTHVFHRPIDIYLYASTSDLSAALAAGMDSGTEALTLYETNVILVSFGPEGVNIPKLERVLPHEVTHALIHEATQSDHDHVPRWLSEGLATSVEYAFVPDPDAPSLLKQAIQEGEWLPLDTLCAAFPRDPAHSRLAYAQSASLVDYIRDRYGRQDLRDLVAAYADGATCEGGVNRVLDSTLSRLEAQWLTSLEPGSRWARLFRDAAPWLILLASFATLLIFFVWPAYGQSGDSRASPQ
jgi:hypothetical protein